MIVVDTGPLGAVAGANEAYHQTCTGWFDACADPVVVPGPVIVEVCWLLGRRGGLHAEHAFLAGLFSGDPTVLELTPADYQCCADLVGTYADLDLGFVDASVIAVPERLSITTVATVNHRVFRVVRPVRCDAFDLVPGTATIGPHMLEVIGGQVGYWWR